VQKGGACWAGNSANPLSAQTLADAVPKQPQLSTCSAMTSGPGQVTMSGTLTGVSRVDMGSPP